MAQNSRTCLRLAAACSSVSVDGTASMTWELGRMSGVGSQESTVVALGRVRANSFMESRIGSKIAGHVEDRTTITEEAMRPRTPTLRTSIHPRVRRDGERSITTIARGRGATIANAKIRLSLGQV